MSEKIFGRRPVPGWTAREVGFGGLGRSHGMGGANGARVELTGAEVTKREDVLRRNKTGTHASASPAQPTAK